MKKILFTLCFFTLSLICHSQECEMFSPMKEGAELKYTVFNESKEVLGKNIHKVSNVIREGAVTITEIEFTTFNKKGEEVYSTIYSAECNNGDFYIDMLRFFDQNKLAEHVNVDIEIEGDFLGFPKLIKTTTRLLDGSITVIAGSNKPMTMSMNNRKLLGEEKLTVAAGTFDCYKMSYDFTSDFGTGKLQGNGITWYAKDIGVIKSEVYNTAGKLVEYTELISSK